MQFILIIYKGYFVMYLGPLYLLEWTALVVIGLGGQIYVIMSIISMVDLAKGFHDYLVYKRVLMYG